MNTSMSRIQWLDSLRGLAALIVALDHLFLGTVNAPFRSYWAQPAADNQYFYQLPPISIIFAAKSMVALFMVLSGYSISASLVLARNRGALPQFYQKLTSAAFRRIFRLYIPVFTMATVAQIALYLGFYHWWWPQLDAIGVVPWGSPTLHLRYYVAYLADSLNILEISPNPGLNDQLWTIPRELRGSFCVYLTMLALCGISHRARLCCIMATALYTLWYGDWDIFGFFSGLLMAEVTLGGVEDYRLPESREPSASSSETKLPSSHRTFPLFWRHYGSHVQVLTKIFLFLFSFWLLCQPFEEHWSPGYRFLASLIPPPWRSRHWEYTKFSVSTIGSVGLVTLIINVPVLQRILSIRPFQFLGEVSFALYLMHVLYYRCLRNPIMNFTYRVFTGRDFWDGEDVWEPIPECITVSHHPFNPKFLETNANFGNT
ncbi:hypothetical protein JX265_003821 [Neoarthrinium moseri]|uniref:Acyltransferase 3 domain-containing protein n=1 Tax=Neoarthrinium moseri TaxID=1658444 RepID=A0A9P9WSZ9_9PEZI|nr:hypothetical protein JX265_003821 [Neoarthrinium moseri]